MRLWRISVLSQDDHYIAYDYQQEKVLHYSEIYVR